MRILAVSLFCTLALAPFTTGARAGGDGVRVDASKLGAAEKIYVYADGSIALDRSIEPDSDEARAIADWLKSHEEGWKYSFLSSITTYAPHEYVRGRRFTLNFTSGGRFCILNYQDGKGGAWHQLTRKIAKDDPIPKVFHAVP